MKICFICDEYPPSPHGGIGTFVKGLSHALVERGHQVWVVGVFGGLDRLEVSMDQGVRVQRLPGSRWNGRLGFVDNRWRLSKVVERLVREEHIDVVESADSGGWAVFLRVGAAKVKRLHSSTPVAYRRLKLRRGRLLELAESLDFRRSDSICGVSKWVWDAQRFSYPLSGLKNRPTRVIYNGVDMGVFSPDPNKVRSPLRIVFAGTIKQQKGVKYLLAGFKIVLKKLPGAELILAGSECYSGYFDSLLDGEEFGTGERERVRWDGRRPLHAIADLYRSAAVCVFPSLAESFGLVAAEAMACGTPVIYTSRSAGPEVIEDGISGLLVDPTDETAIAEAIVRVLTDEELARRLGASGAQRVNDNFSFRRCADETIRLYEEAIDDTN